MRGRDETEAGKKNFRDRRETGGRGAFAGYPACHEFGGHVGEFDHHGINRRDRHGGSTKDPIVARHNDRQAVIDHRGIPPYRQTRQYVSRILRRLDLDDAKAWDPSQRWRKASS